ncbi:hypothetical protein ACVW0V_009557 [Bradyrhizobium elkanii]
MTSFSGFLLDSEAIGLDLVVLEHLHGGGHRADLVLARGARDRLGDFTRGKARHPAGEGGDRVEDAAADHDDQTGADGNDREQPDQRHHEAEARRRIGARKALLGILVECVAHGDDGGEADLGFGIIGLDVLLILAGDRAFLGELQGLAETLDIVGLHLAQRRQDIGRCRRIVAQFLQRREDLLGAAGAAEQLQLFLFGRDALGADQRLVQAGIKAAGVAQRPGHIGVAGLAVGVAVKAGEAAHLLVEQHGDAGVEDGVVGDDLGCRRTAGVDRTCDRLLDRVAERGELGLQRIDRARNRFAVVERAGQHGADLIDLGERAVGQLAQLVEIGDLLLVDRAGAEQEVGGHAALGVHVARDVADGADDFEPALRGRDLVHGLVLGHRDIGRQSAADRGQ